MATSIFFNGRVISVPGSYSEVDPSGLEQVGLGAAGIVAVLGTAEGGRPVSDMSEPKDFLRLTKPEQKTMFRSGDLREIMDPLFAPSKDADILAGAQSVVAMKVNPATQSVASFANSSGNAMDVESVDFGAFTEQINVAIANGTTKGKLLTIVFEDITESVDNLGGDNMFTLQYAGGTYGYTTMVGEILAGGSIKTTGTKSAGGADSLITTQLAGNGTIEVVSNNAGDTNAVTAYGLDAALAAVKETLTLSGTTPVVGTQVFSKVFGVSIDQTVASLGTVLTRASGAGATIFSMVAGTEQAGAVKLDYGYVNNTTVSVAANGATTKRALVFGKSTSGASIGAVITLAGSTPVVSTGVNFSRVERIVTGEVEVARTLTMTAVAATAVPTVQSTLQKAADYFNSKQVILAGPVVRGFIFTMVTAQMSLSIANLDVTVAAASILSPASVGFKADLYTMIAWINQNSQYITAAAAAGAKGGFPSNTANPVFLAGGTEGTALFAHWQAALNLLKQTRVNSIVVLTPDPAVHAALDAHCAYMCGIGRSERDGFVGLMNTAMTDLATKIEIKAQIVNLNTRHIRATAQAIERYNSAGERVELSPVYAAAIAAGMQAGAPVGTSLTFKYANVLSARQDSSWNPTDDAEEMVNAGLLFMANVEGVGRRWVRNVTTYLAGNNLAYIEGSVNQAVNYAAYNFRSNMEVAVGKRGFAGTINAAKGVAIGTLGLLVDNTILVAWRALGLELIVDVMEVSCEIAPIIPINFVRNTIHLVTIRQAA